jgi:hypothetical protein
MWTPNLPISLYKTHGTFPFSPITPYHPAKNPTGDAPLGVGTVAKTIYKIFNGRDPPSGSGAGFEIVSALVVGGGKVKEGEREIEARNRRSL